MKIFAFIFTFYFQDIFIPSSSFFSFPRIMSIVSAILLAHGAIQFLVFFNIYLFWKKKSLKFSDKSRMVGVCAGLWFILDSRIVSLSFVIGLAAFHIDCDSLWWLVHALPRLDISFCGAEFRRNGFSSWKTIDAGMISLDKFIESS